MSFWKILLLLPLFLHAQILPIDSIDEVVVEITDVLFFDVDDTLIRYPSHLGSEPWFCEACQRSDFQELATLLFHKLPVVPVEPRVVSLIDEFQQQGIEVVGITARKTSHPEEVLDQVHSVGISFSPSIYREGLLLVGKKTKGECILALFEASGKTPKRVLLVDDRLSQLEEVEKTLEEEGIPFTGYWYRAIEPSRSAYDEITSRSMQEEGVLK